MQRNRYEVNAGPDSRFPELRNEFRTIDLEMLQIQAQCVQMPGMPAVLLISRNLELLSIPKDPVVIMSDTSSFFDEVVQLLELVDSDGGHDVRKVVFESGLQDFVVPITPV